MIKKKKQKSNNKSNQCGFSNPSALSGCVRCTDLSLSKSRRQYEHITNGTESDIKNVLHPSQILLE